MAARLTDRQKKKILADYVQTNNYCATAKINGVSATTVKNIVRANADILEKCEQKREENTKEVLDYIQNQGPLMCDILKAGLDALNDPEKLKKASVSQIATMIAIIVDKSILIRDMTGSGGADKVEVVIDV